MSGRITAFTLQRLNEVAVSHAKYEVDETVRLNEFGGGVTTRRSKPALVRIPVAMFEKEISELLGALSNYAIEKFRFVVGHAFTTASLELSTKPGMRLPSRSTRSGRRNLESIRQRRLHV